MTNDVVDNFQENLEDEKRRLVVQIGKSIVSSEYILALQWAEMLLSLELQTRSPRYLAILGELYLKLLISGLTLTVTLIKELCHTTAELALTEVSSRPSSETGAHGFWPGVQHVDAP